MESSQNETKNGPQPQSAEARKNAEAKVAGVKKGVRTPYSHLFRVVHWVIGISLVGLIYSGISLHASAHPGWSLFDGIVRPWMWEGPVGVFHLVLGVLFSAAAISIVFCYSQRNGKRQTTHLVLLVGSLLTIGTGLIMLKPYGPSEVYVLARLTHTVVGLVVLPLAFAWHFWLGVTKRRPVLVPAFHPTAAPRWRTFFLFFVLLFFFGGLIFGLVTKPGVYYDLVAERLETPEDDLRALPWSKTRPLVVPLANGIGFDRGRTDVTLRALHDGNELFVLAEWNDPTESRHYIPWQKTADGWKRLVTNPKDETVFYEDKFSLVFPLQPDGAFERFGCAVYCHLGEGHGYGCKEAHQPSDVWHWKAVRTDGSGQVDDKYWTREDEKGGPRRGDPKKGGGYKKNESGDAPHPAKLPDQLASIRKGAIPIDKAVNYSRERAERIVEETVVPGILSAPFVGDRGDVTCQSYHEDGRWRLYIRRKLDTGSQFDVEFVPGQSRSFGVAAFDHTGKRHAYDYSVYRLRLEE